MWAVRNLFAANKYLCICLAVNVKVCGCGIKVSKKVIDCPAQIMSPVEALPTKLGPSQPPLMHKTSELGGSKLGTHLLGKVSLQYWAPALAM